MEITEHGIRQYSATIDGIRDDHVNRYLYAARVVRERAGRDQPLLDAGCGCGYGARLLAEETGAFVSGIDHSEEAIRYAQQHYAHALVDYRQTTFGGAVDYRWAATVMFEVIEHAEDAPDFLARMSAQCPWLVGSVPNEAVVPFTPGKSNRDHYRHYTPIEIMQELDRAGWEAVQIGSQAGKKGAAAAVREGDLSGRTLVFVAKSKRAKQ